MRVTALVDTAEVYTTSCDHPSCVGATAVTFLLTLAVSFFLWLKWTSQEATKIFEEMQEAGVTPGLMSYNTLISGCVRAEAPNEALAVFNVMKEKGVKRDQVMLFCLVLFSVRGDFLAGKLRIISLSMCLFFVVPANQPQKVNVEYHIHVGGRLSSRSRATGA